MSELKSAILDAKYLDMIELADFVVRDCGLPDMDESGEMLPQQNEIAAAIFRWAAGAQLGRRGTPAVANGAGDGEHDHHGDPKIGVAGAEARVHAAEAQGKPEDAE
ncbi:hypothetical protein [Roseivivax sediminis]|uniref:Uncharacterized protein n=1 Tax=Roseivivax sediminis TaxID=936889 RepID=A0A1I1VGG7_9RHOB|nr:hypothetical protein [Roseivivax sediminis]SFD81994.1 hypothetical protein SAMN04515678_103184 [Roseivivax sediminis]